MSNMNLRQAAVIEEKLPEEFSGAPVLPVEQPRIWAVRNRLRERQSDGSQWVRKEVVR